MQRLKKCYFELYVTNQRFVYYTSPQSIIITISNLLAQQRWGLLFNFDWFVLQIECPHVLTLNEHWGSGNFM